MAIIDALKIVSISDPGKIRGHNEDCVEARPDHGVVVLADGMGGYNAGEVASGMATSSISNGLAEIWTPEKTKSLSREDAKQMAESVLAEQVITANRNIFEASQKDARCAGMGTTLVACLFYDNFMTVAHVGDSRLYCLRGNELLQVTRDHSLLQEQIDAGLISKEDARSSSNKNLVTRAVGIDPTVEPEIHTYDVKPGELYLLCSDGLNDMIDDEEIRMTLIALRSNIDLTAKQLVQAANDAGGRDNISVMLVDVRTPFPAKRGLLERLRSWFK